MKNTTMTTEVNTCHLCDGRSFITIEQRDFRYKGEGFNVNQYFYKCQECGEEYTTDELDSETMRQVYFEYWKNHVDGIAVEDEIEGIGNNLRQSLNLEIAEMDANASKFFKSVYQNTPRIIGR